MLKPIFQWLDQHPDAYWVGAALATIALLAAVIQDWRRPEDAAPRRNRIFALLLLFFLLAWRWPYLLAVTEYNPDESQFIAGAMTLTHDPVFWRSVDGGTAGPLDFYALLPLHWAGFPLDYFSARLTALLLSWAALLVCRRIFRAEAPSVPAGLLVLPAAVFFAAGTEPDFVHYSSHHLSLLLLVLAVHWRERRPWTAAVMAGLLPWAKLQTAPLAAVLVGWQCWRIWSGPAATGEKARRSAAVLAAGALPSLLALGLLAATGQLEHFYRSYLVQSFTYVAGSLPRSVALRQMWDSAQATGHLPLWLGSIVLMAGAAVIGGRRVRPTGDLGGLALLLTATAAFCIYAPGRASLHYSLLLVFPLTLALGAVVGGPTATPGRWTAAGFLLVALLPLGWRARQPGPEMFGQFAEDWRRPYSMRGSVLRAYRDTAGSLALWGWHNSVYVEAGLPQGTRDTASAWSIFETPQREYYRARYLADMERNRPGLFVDAVGPGAPFFPDRRTQAHETFPALADYVRTHYRLLLDLWDARIYVRNDVLAQHAYTKTDLQRFLARGRPPADTETKPDLVVPADAASDEIGGRVVQMILPPAELTWHLEGVEREVEVDYGFHPKAYTEGRSNGAWFIMELRAPGQPPQELFRRLLDPARQPADRRPLHTRLPLPPFPPGASLVVRTDAGEFGDNAWDWVYLARLQFLRLPFYAASQFPGFARQPDDAEAPHSAIIDQGPEQRLMLPAPAQLTYVLDGSEHQLECVLGFQPGAYENGGQTNGVILRAELQRAGRPAAIVFERRFDPVGVSADRGPQPVGFALGPVQPGDRLVLIIDPAGNNSWDWTYLTGLSLR